MTGFLEKSESYNTAKTCNFDVTLSDQRAMPVADLVQWAFENGAARSDLIGATGPAGYRGVDFMKTAELGVSVDGGSRGGVKLHSDVELILDAIGRCPARAQRVIIDHALLGQHPDPLPEISQVVDLFGEEQRIQVFGTDGQLLSHISTEEWHAARMEPVRTTPFEDDDTGEVQDFVQQVTPGRWVSEHVDLNNLNTARGVRRFIDLLRTHRRRHHHWFWGLAQVYADLLGQRHKFKTVDLDLAFALRPAPDFESVMATCTIYLAQATRPSGTDVRGMFEWLTEVEVRPDLLARYSRGEARMALAKLRSELRRARHQDRTPKARRDKSRRM